MKKIILSILLGSSILSNGVYGSAGIEDDHQDPSSGQSTSLKRKRGENDAHTLIPQKRLRGEVTITPRSEVDAEIRSHLNSIISFQGASLPCSEEGEVYLQLLSKNQTLTDKDFHQLFRIEYSRLQSLNSPALKEIQKLFYDEDNFFYELENSENKQTSRMLLSFGLWDYYHNKDFHVRICAASMDLGQFYFTQYAMEHFNLAPNYLHLSKMIECSEASSDISYFRYVLDKLTMNLFDGSHDEDFSNLLNEVTEKNLVHYAEELIRRHPNFGKIAIRKKLRESALSTALERGDIELIKKLVPTDEDNMITLVKNPLIRAIKTNSIEVMKYFLSFQKNQKKISWDVMEALFLGEANTNTIKIFCDHECNKKRLPAILERAISYENIEIIKYLVEEKNVPITAENFKSLKRTLFINTDILDYFIEKSNASFRPDLLLNLLGLEDKEKKQELLIKLANRIDYNSSSNKLSLLKFINRLCTEKENFEAFILSIEDTNSFNENLEKSFKHYLSENSRDEKKKNEYESILKKLRNTIESIQQSRWVKG